MFNLRYLFPFLGFMLTLSVLTAQDSSEAEDFSLLLKAMLAESSMESDLYELCDQIGGRVTGSEANNLSVEWAYEKMSATGVKTIKDPFEMPSLWLAESTSMNIHSDQIPSFRVNAVSKYQTPAGNYKAKLTYLGAGTDEDFKENTQDLSESFVFVDADICLDINGLFKEYTDAAIAEINARKRGAKGIIFMSSRPNKLLYRFITTKTSDNKLPQFVMAREDAKRCIRLIEDNLSLNVSIDCKATQGETFISENVIAEIKGSVYPEEVIIIGAHLDSWALGTGANDNACNVSMMIDIARQMKKLNIKPKRTIRFALWNGEEQGYFGSWHYTKTHQDELDNHKMALSVDIGSGDIIGFFTNGRDDLIPFVDQCLASVDSIGNYLNINNPIVGTDNFDFMLEGVPNLVAIHKPASYGLNYHASSDTYDKVDLVALNKNSAIVAALVLSWANADKTRLDTFKRQSRSEIQSMFEKHDLEFTMRMFNVWEPWINGSRGIE